MKSNNTIIKLKIFKILKIVSIVIFSLILLFVLIVFGFAIHNYRQLLPFEKGYHHEDTVGNFDYNGKTYSIDSDFGDTNKLGKYYDCKDKTDKSLHIVADNNILIAIFQDYKVSAIKDDPNGYVYKGETDLFGPLTYYSDNIQEPSPEKNKIRQIVICYTLSIEERIIITEKTLINKIITCVRNNENPELVLADAGIKLSDHQKEYLNICIDYSDFPLYQVIYNKKFTNFVCPIIQTTQSAESSITDS